MHTSLDDSSRRAEKTRPAFLYAAGFAMIGVQLPFFPIWLERQDLGPSAIGILLAIPVLVRILVTAPLMTLIDRGLRPRTLLLCANLTLALAFAACSVAGGLMALTALVLAIAVAQAPIIPATDLIALAAVRNSGSLDYGRLRLWGSIAFLAASIGAGYLVMAAGRDSVVALLAGLALASALVTHVCVPRGAIAGGVPAADGEGGAVPARLPRALWLAMAAAACTQASHAAIYGFGSIHWGNLGFSGSTIGLLWAMGVVAEIFVLALLGRTVGKAGWGFAFLMIGAAAAILRFGAMAAEPGPLATFALQALHGLTFGITYLGTMAALSALAPEAARGRAQGTLSALTALATAGGTTLSGFAFESSGALIFAAMTPLAAAGFLFALAAARAAPQPQSAGSGG